MRPMGTLTMVRHGQASFGADDYDQLSELGARQCRLLGEYWRARGRRFDAVLTGTLKRHAQSFAAIAEGLGGAPEPLLWPGLDEYDSDALTRAIHPAPLARPPDAEEVRAHFRLLRRALQAWMSAEIAPEGMPSYAAFSAGVAAALAHVREQHPQGQVLIVSSGGPISTAVGQVLGAPLEAVIEMNMRIRNSALTEFVSSSPRRHTLLSFNHLPHLDAVELQGLESYA